MEKAKSLIFGNFQEKTFDVSNKNDISDFVNGSWEFSAEAENSEVDPNFVFPRDPNNVIYAFESFLQKRKLIILLASENFVTGYAISS